jgi:hypothetical protein
VNNFSLFYDGIVCVSLALLGLLLTILEFRRMSPSRDPIDLTRQSEEQEVQTATDAGCFGSPERAAAVDSHV